MFNWLFKNPFKVQKFISAYIVTNYSCNNKCKWCYSNYYIKQKDKVSLDFGFAKEIIRLLSEIGVQRINILGGEPTLYKYILELISFIRSCKMDAVIITNGRRLSNIDFLKDLKKSGISRIAVSIEGCDSKSQSEITGISTSFNETIQGLRNCFSENINFQTNTVISHENIQTYYKLIDILKEIGLQYISMSSCTPPLKIDYDFSNFMGLKKQANLIENLYIYGKKIGLEIGSLFRMPLCLLSSNVRDEMLSKNLLQNGCNVYSGNSFAINPDGTILPCSHFMGYSVMSLADKKHPLKAITKKQFLKMWNKGEPLKTRKNVWKYRSKKCIGCKYYAKLCFAGCPLFWYRFDPQKEIVGLKE